jgi:hypothetical protein
VEGAYTALALPTISQALFCAAAAGVDTGRRFENGFVAVVNLPFVPKTIEKRTPQDGPRMSFMTGFSFRDMMKNGWWRPQMIITTVATQGITANAAQREIQQVPTDGAPAPNAYVEHEGATAIAAPAQG